MEDDVALTSATSLRAASQEPPTAAAMGPDAEGIEVDRTAELAEGLGGRFEAVVAALG